MNTIPVYIVGIIDNDDCHGMISGTCGYKFSMIIIGYHGNQLLYKGLDSKVNS